MRRVYLAYCVSGFVSLGYQVVWFRVFADRFGSSSLTFALVVVNFILGLGLGAFVSRRLSDRLAMFPLGRPRTRAYGLVELGVSAAMLLTIVGEAPGELWGPFPYRLAADGIYHATLAYRASQIALATVSVLLPCVFMGMTFPMLCAAFPTRERLPSVLYAWNTLGACAGVLACQFALLPTIGHDRTLWLMIGMNILLGLVFLVWIPPQAQSSEVEPPKIEPVVSGARLSRLALLALALSSGLLTGALEADAFKRAGMSGLRTGSAMALISFWAILAIFLASAVARGAGGVRLLHVKLIYTLALVYSVTLFGFVYPMRDAVMSSANEFTVLPDPLGPLLLIIGLLVFPPFFCVSLLFPAVCNELQSRRTHLGAAYGLNTVGFCLGMLAFTWLAPRVSIFYSLKLFPLLFAIVALWLWLVPRAGAFVRWKTAVVAALLLSALVLTPRGFDKRFIDPVNAAYQSPVRGMRSDWDHTLYVVEHPTGDRLYFDSHSMSGTGQAAQQYMRLMAHLPLLAQQDPRQALVICFGVGNTASAVLKHESIERLDVVDLSSLVFRMAPEFANTNQRVYEDPRIRMIADDGRSYLDRTEHRYDLITSEPPPPMHEGVYRLYSREYYEAVLGRLTETGMMTQWLPAGQMPAEAVRLATSTFIEVFPFALLYVGQHEEYLLVGGRQPLDFALLEREFAARAAVREDLLPFQIRTPGDLIARVAMGDRALREEFGGRATISDQRNDLSFLPIDATGLTVIDYDPTRLMQELDTRDLAAAGQLARTWNNVALLLSRVPDFPLSALRSVRSRGTVRYSGADWSRVGSLNNRAVQAERSGNLAEAARLYEQSLAEVSEQLTVLYELGRFYAQGGNLRASLMVWQRYRAIEPDDGMADLCTGWVLLTQRSYEDALRYGERAARAVPTDGRTFQLQGDALAGLGRHADAVRAYDAALAASPWLEEVARSRERALAAAGR